MKWKHWSKETKGTIITLMVSALIFPAISGFMSYAFSDVVVVCGRVKEASQGKGTHLIYFYKYGGEIHKGSFTPEGNMSANSMVYKNRCVDIEVSTRFPSLSRLKKYNK